MIRLAAVAVSVIAAVAFAGPEVKIDCPAGMHFVNNKGCVANVAQKVECPGGTHFEGGKCVAIIDTSCPAGMRFVTGTGCVASKTAAAPQPAADAPPPPPERPAAEPTGKKKGGTFTSGFVDRLQATCAGIPIEVHGAPRFTGTRAMLLVDGRKMGEEENVDVGQTRTISGKHGKQEVDLKVQQGLWGTRYTLKVDGVECRLAK